MIPEDKGVISIMACMKILIWVGFTNLKPRVNPKFGQYFYTQRSLNTLWTRLCKTARVFVYCLWARVEAIFFVAKVSLALKNAGRRTADVSARPVELLTRGSHYFEFASQIVVLCNCTEFASQKSRFFSCEVKYSLVEYALRLAVRGLLFCQFVVFLLTSCSSLSTSLWLVMTSVVAGMITPCLLVYWPSKNLNYALKYFK